MKNTNYLVKKLQSYWVLFFALLFCGTIQAKVNHYVGGYGHVGEWSLFPSESDYTASFGVAGGLGFLYELQAGPTYSTPFQGAPFWGAHGSVAQLDRATAF